MTISDLCRCAGIDDITPSGDDKFTNIPLSDVESTMMNQLCHGDEKYAAAMKGKHTAVSIEMIAEVIGHQWQIIDGLAEKVREFDEEIL